MTFLQRLFRRDPVITPAQAVAALVNRPMGMAPRALETLLAAATTRSEREPPMPTMATGIHMACSRSTSSVYRTALAS